MRYQKKASIIFEYLRQNFPNCPMVHRWDFKLDVEWYILQFKKLRIRILVPKMFFESVGENELEPKLESLNLNSYIKNCHSNYIVISNSGLNIETF